MMVGWVKSAQECNIYVVVCLLIQGEDHVFFGLDASQEGTNNAKRVGGLVVGTWERVTSVASTNMSRSF